jgi:hypothetical protein
VQANSKESGIQPSEDVEKSDRAPTLLKLSFLVMVCARFWLCQKAQYLRIVQNIKIHCGNRSWHDVFLMVLLA